MYEMNNVLVRRASHLLLPRSSCRQLLSSVYELTLFRSQQSTVVWWCSGVATPPHFSQQERSVGLAIAPQEGNKETACL